MVFRKKRRDDEEPEDISRDDEVRDDVFGRRDIFGSGFDGFFGDFKRIDEMMNELMKGAFSGKGFEDGKPFVYGFSLKSGPDGKPVFEEFGNVKPGPTPRATPRVSDSREPLVDVINREDSVIVIAELPGVSKEDINLEATGSSLEIKVDKEGKKFYKQVALPADVKEDGIEATYNNGVLEVKLKKKQVEKQKSKKIVIK